MVNRVSLTRSRPYAAAGDAVDRWSGSCPGSEASDEVANESSDRNSAADVPNVVGLTELERRCASSNDERELWQCLAIAAARRINPPADGSWASELLDSELDGWRQALRQLASYRDRLADQFRYDGCQPQTVQDEADTVLADEFNLFVLTLFQEEGDEEMATATKANRSKSTAALVRGHARNVVSPTTMGLPAPTDEIPADVAPSARNKTEQSPSTDVPTSKVIPNTKNPRKRFSSEQLEELVNSIRRIGILQPLVVRPADEHGLYDLIAGERRLRAAIVAQLPTVPVRIVELTDLQVAAARLEENLTREDLSPIEEALGYQEMLDQFSGLTQEKLAEQVGRSRPHISNRLRLLKLPKGWQELLAAGEITDHHGWALVPFADVAPIMDALLNDAKKNKVPVDPKRFADNVDSLVCRASRPLQERYFWDGNRQWESVDLQPTDDEAKLLQVFKHNGKDRCWNIKEWERLALAQARQRAEREAKAAEKKKGGTKAADPKAAAKAREKQAEIYHRKLWRYYVAWHQEQLLKRFDSANAAPPAEQVALWLLFQGSRPSDFRIHRDRELSLALGLNHNANPLAEISAPETYRDRWEDVVHETARRWLSHTFEGYHTDLKPEAVVAFAQSAGVSIADHWRLDEAFLQLHNRVQLQELAREWKVNDVAHEKMKRGDLIDDLIRAAAAATVPKRLQKPRAVDLAR